MSLQSIKLENATAVPLTEDDVCVLTTVYGSRLRTFFLVFPAVSILTSLYVAPRLLSVFAKDNADLPFKAGLVVGILLFLLPFLILFYKRIWLVRQDLKSGIKLQVNEQIIRKEYFPHTDQYFLALSDADYMHHEVTAATYEAVQVGDFYPVYFAAHSRYPFTLRARITMM